MLFDRVYEKKVEQCKKIKRDSTARNKGITLIALVVTIVLKCCEAAVERMLRKVKELKREKTSDII